MDLPEIMDLRARLLPREELVRPVPRSALDVAWMDEVDASHGVLVTAEGLLMYLQPLEAMALIRDCAARFPGGAMIFDSIPAWFSRRTMKGLALSPTYTAPPMPFGLTVDQAAALAGSIPGVASVQDLALPPGRGLWRVTPAWVYRIPRLRNARPSITLLRFAPESPN